MGQNFTQDSGFTPHDAVFPPQRSTLPQKGSSQPSSRSSSTSQPHSSTSTRDTRNSNDSSGGKTNEHSAKSTKGEEGTVKTRPEQLEGYPPGSTPPPNRGDQFYGSYGPAYQQGYGGWPGYPPQYWGYPPNPGLYQQFPPQHAPSDPSQPPPSSMPEQPVPGGPPPYAWPGGWTQGAMQQPPAGWPGFWPQYPPCPQQNPPNGCSHSKCSGHGHSSYHNHKDRRQVPDSHESSSDSEEYSPDSDREESPQHTHRQLPQKKHEGSRNRKEERPRQKGNRRDKQPPSPPSPPSPPPPKYEEKFETFDTWGEGFIRPNPQRSKDPKSSPKPKDPPSFSDREPAASPKAIEPKKESYAPRFDRESPERASVVKRSLGRSNQTITVLLIGETGSGKSTFINYLANFFYHGSRDNLKLVIPMGRRNANVEGFSKHTEAHLGDNTKSQTKGCTTYTFHLDWTTYNFIDTPGLCDTNGVKADDDNISLILNAAKNAGSLHAVLLIINGTVARQTVNIKNAQMRIAGNYPDALLKNLFVVYTNCTTERNFDESSLLNKPKKSFSMNNHAFSSLTSSKSKREERIEEMIWEASMDTIEDILANLEELPPVSTKAFHQMIKHREAIKSEIVRTIEAIKKQQQMIDYLERLKIDQERAEHQTQTQREQLNSVKQNLQEASTAVSERNRLQIEAEAKKRAAERKVQDDCVTFEEKKQLLYSKTQHKAANQQGRITIADTEYEEEINYIEFVETPYHNTLCQHEECLEPCHERCGLEFIQNRGDNRFQSCACMNGTSSCNECKHGFADHYHDNHKKERRVMKTKKVYEEKLALYYQQNAEAAQLDIDIQNLTEEQDRLKQEKEAAEKKCRDLAQLEHANAEEVKRAKKQLQEMEVKERAVSQQLSEEMSKMDEITSKCSATQAMIEQEKATLQHAKSTVERCCRELKAICRNFNFVDELRCMIDSLKTAQRTLRLRESVNEAGEFIKSLEALADLLTSS